MKVYRMPNGRTYRFADKDVPPGAVLVEKAKKKEEVETKAKTTANKAKKPANKAKKAETK